MLRDDHDPGIGDVRIRFELEPLEAPQPRRGDREGTEQRDDAVSEGQIEEARDQV
jgi:hypothetical protein